MDNVVEKINLEEQLKKAREKAKEEGNEVPYAFEHNNKIYVF
jgi:hypothetical protein